MSDHHPPLTEDEFNAGCALTYNGVTFCEDEQGCYVYGYGHIDKAAFAEALNAYDLDNDPAAEGYKASDVQHRWAVTVEPVNSPNGWYVRWGQITKDTPGAFALTVVTR